MSGNSSNNSQILIQQEIWNGELEETLFEYLSGCPFVREIEFPMGVELTLPSIGTPVVRDYLNDDDEFKVDVLDTGEYHLYMGRPIYTANSVTRCFEEDSIYAAEMRAALPSLQAQAVQEQFESAIFELANHQSLGQNNANLINQYAHRKVATGTNETIQPSDFSYARLALKKAKIRGMGLVAFVDPTVAYALENLTNITNVSNNPQWQGIIETGIENNFRFVRNVFGFDVFETNMLADANETIGGKTTTAGKANIFTALGAGEMNKPFVVAWRRRPMLEVIPVPLKDNQRIAVTTARYGKGLAKDENLVVILSDTDQAA